jgi:hypothetical protein
VSYFAGLILALEYFLATCPDVVGAAQQPAQRFGAGEDDSGVFLEELEKALLAWHERLKQRAYWLSASRTMHNDLHGLNSKL